MCAEARALLTSRGLVNHRCSRTSGTVHEDKKSGAFTRRSSSSNRTILLVNERVEGWCSDPYSRHQVRWMSEGKPTDLVKDGDIEGRDPVSDVPFRVSPVPLAEVSQGFGDLERADDPRSWEPPLHISEKVVARRQKKELIRERGPFYWLPVDTGLRRMLAVCVSGVGLLILDFFGLVWFIAYGVAVAVPSLASRLWMKRRRGESSAEVL